MTGLSRPDDGLLYRWRDPMTGRMLTTVVGADGCCWKCGREGVDLAHAVYEYVAALFWRRLADAFDEHVESCLECRGGLCPQGSALLDLVPNVVLIG